MFVTYWIESMAYLVLGQDEATDPLTAVAALVDFTVISIGVAGLVVRVRSE